MNRFFVFVFATTLCLAFAASIAIADTKTSEIQELQKKITQEQALIQKYLTTLRDDHHVLTHAQQALPGLQAQWQQVVRQFGPGSTQANEAFEKVQAVHKDIASIQANMKSDRTSLGAARGALQGDETRLHNLIGH